MQVAIRMALRSFSFVLILVCYMCVAFGQAPATQPLPREMAEQVSADTGQPSIIREYGNVIWALSTKTVAQGEPIPVLLWLYNSTDKPQFAMTCSDIGFFWNWGIDLFDSSGRRILNTGEQLELADPTKLNVPICTRNFAIPIPPHSVIHGNFSKMEYDFSKDLRTLYPLLPERYVVVPSELGKDFKRVERTVLNPPNRLDIEITEH